MSYSTRYHDPRSIRCHPGLALTLSLSLSLSLCLCLSLAITLTLASVIMKLSGEVGLLYVMFIKMWAEVQPATPCSLACNPA